MRESQVAPHKALSTGRAVTLQRRAAFDISGRLSACDRTGRTEEHPDRSGAPRLSEVCSQQQRGQLCGLQHPRSFLQCHNSMQAGAQLSKCLISKPYMILLRHGDPLRVIFGKSARLLEQSMSVELLCHPLVEGEEKVGRHHVQDLSFLDVGPCRLWQEQTMPLSLQPSMIVRRQATPRAVDPST